MISFCYYHVTSEIITAAILVSMYLEDGKPSAVGACGLQPRVGCWELLPFWFGSWGSGSRFGCWTYGLGLSRSRVNAEEKEATWNSVKCHADRCDTYMYICICIYIYVYIYTHLCVFFATLAVNILLSIRTSADTNSQHYEVSNGPCT